MVQVFYEELNYETLSESVAYSLTSLFADLGGLTGLWIGISLVSILEVFQLIWFCLDFYRNRKLVPNRVVNSEITKEKNPNFLANLDRNLGTCIVCIPAGEALVFPYKITLL